MMTVPHQILLLEAVRNGIINRNISMQDPDFSMLHQVTTVNLLTSISKKATIGNEPILSKCKHLRGALNHIVLLKIVLISDPSETWCSFNERLKLLSPIYRLFFKSPQLGVFFW